MERERQGRGMERTEKRGGGANILCLFCGALLFGFLDLVVGEGAGAYEDGCH